MDLVGDRRHARGRLRRSVRRRWAAGWWSAERDPGGVRRDGLGEGMDHPVREFDDEARQGEAAHQNEGTIEHNFVIEGTSVDLEAIPPGSTKEVTVDLKPGTYNVLCTIAGHSEAGMKTTITVAQ